MTLPQVRAAPWYQGQIGVPGSDVQRGLRWESCGIVLYVDGNHPNATAFADGTNPEEPLTTVQIAVDRLSQFATAMGISLEGSVIVVAAEATLAESVLVPATAPANCTIMGTGNPHRGPTWASAAAAENCLELRAPGWTIRNIRFQPNTAAAGIYLVREAADAYAAHHTVIVDCDFDGRWSGLYGIHTYGTPSQVYVLNNVFHELTQGAVAGAIYIDQAPQANPFLWVVQDNIFWENDNHIFLDDNTCGANGCLFKGNSFFLGVNIVATTMIDMRGGTLGGNVFVENFFGGEYTHAGGYWENATFASSWVGNFTTNVGLGTVGDNGLTIAVPL